jgi:hypothetical protein
MQLLKQKINELRVCTHVCKRGVHLHRCTFSSIKNYYKSYSYSTLITVHVQVCTVCVHIFLFLLINNLQSCARAPYYVGESTYFPLHSGGLYINHHT